MDSRDRDTGSRRKVSNPIHFREGGGILGNEVGALRLQILCNGEGLIQVAGSTLADKGIQAGEFLPTTGNFESAGLELISRLSPLRHLRYAAVQPTISLDNFDCG